MDDKVGICRRSVDAAVELLSLRHICIIGQKKAHQGSSPSDTFPPASACTRSTTMSSQIEPQELSQHASRQSCWIAIHGTAWDVTTFIDKHPGGASLILSQSGKDATSAYEDFHSPELVEQTLGLDAKRGSLRPETAAEKLRRDVLQDKKIPSQAKQPSLRAMISLADFQKMASVHMSPTAWAYVISGADD